MFACSWATVCKAVRLMLSDRCLIVLSVLSVCDVGVLWRNGWMDQDAIWCGGSCLGPGHILLDGNPVRPIPKKKRTTPNFWPMSVVGQRLYG